MSLEEGLKPFHVIPKPLKSETHISDRLWLCDWLKDWTVRRPNYQNDRIWAKSIEDIEEDQRLLWIIKDKDNVIDPDEIIFVHDRAPCNDIWPGNSSDLNVAECIGSIIKDEVETKILSETEYNRYQEDT
ncbi:unnamed protein product [Rotaria magnacalcarata]|uniref:Uncharacterized protein n=1 Tax=Rotaria magnacalcarata TaxID=392030 RepID=A0A816ML26_9BILA|nr:unnamed protein product [Rotaria magnacalcarata]CAF1629369.1 unnamed protein product [Rotaria magnacalcarata]CAF1994381.1 unnamed protein product [Rotaria magnacalcarata]CAF2047811.1 unnamed protein product [Rotaria magnacalcarata]CAF2066947.1 unnamed protein product [Rotaria magnacalcarata]